MKAVGDDPRPAQPTDSQRRVFILHVDDEGAGGARGELPEGGDDVVQRAEIVEMIRVDVEDDRHRRDHLQVMILEFAGFADHGVAAARPAVGLDQREASSDKKGRIHPRLQKDLGNHRSGGGFSMGAGDANGVGIAPGNHAQQLGTLYKGNPLVPGRRQFGVGRADRRRIHHQLRTGNVFRLLLHKNGDSKGTETGDVVGFIDIGTGQLISPGMQDFRDWAHAGTADSHHMDSFDRMQNILCFHDQASNLSRVSNLFIIWLPLPKINTFFGFLPISP